MEDSRQIIAIDPGPVKSAYLIWRMEGDRILTKGIIDSVAILKLFDGIVTRKTVVAVEHVQSFGMAVGASIFDTCYWIGEYRHAIRYKPQFYWNPVYRKDIKYHHCHNFRAKDTNIRQALVDRFGKPGTKKNPGKLYGISKDIWSALAIAVYIADILSGDRI